MCHVRGGTAAFSIAGTEILPIIKLFDALRLVLKQTEQTMLYPYRVHLKKFLWLKINAKATGMI